jgi:hypothetical protein
MPMIPLFIKLFVGIIKNVYKSYAKPAGSFLENIAREKAVSLPH